MAGALADAKGPRTPPDSWAADPRNEVAIWTIRMAPGAVWTMPPASAGVNRVVYPFVGGKLRIDGQDIALPKAVQLRPEVAATFENGDQETEILLLQGRPIGEPVAKHGPFVMNTRLELQQAYDDYRRTRFGGWPWDRDDPVHPREQGRFAMHAGGRRESPA